MDRANPVHRPPGPRPLLPIAPYRSVGPISLGSTPAEIAKLLGRPKYLGKTWNGVYQEAWDELSIRFGSTGLAEEIGMVPPARPTLLAIDLFAATERWVELVRDGGPAFESHGFLILPTLGVALSGFHDGDRSELAVNAFVRGHWDRALERAAPFPPP